MTNDARAMGENNDEPGEELGWREIDGELRRLARAKAGYDAEEVRWLLAGLRARVHVRFGCATFVEYVERLFGYSPRFTSERLRVAEALEDLPAIRTALEAGALSFSSAREVTRVATAATEGEWLEAADGKTAREVERMVSGHQRGERPGDPVDSGARRHVLRFEVSAETMAEFREAEARIRRDAGEPLDQDQIVRLVARHVLGGPSDPGRSSYQVALTVCEACGRGFQDGAGEAIEVGAEVVEMACCDAQEIGHTHVGRPARATQNVPPAIRRQVVRRDHGRCGVPGCRCTRFLDLHHLEARADGGGHDPSNLTLLCASHHAAVHRGFLLIEGTAPDALRFLRADGTSYGVARPMPVSAENGALAFQALKQLGFKDSLARRSVDAAITHVGHGAALDAIIRAALAETRTDRDHGRISTISATA